MTLPFSIGQRVNIAGSPRYESPQEWHPKSFVIGQVEVIDGETVYSVIGMPWYPASSLRLVEELKIGDWVEVILNDTPYTGRIGKVSDVGEEWIALYNMGAWRRSSLRKRTPEEIQQHQTAQMLPKPTELQELRRRVHDLEMSLDGFTNGPEPEYVPGISHVKDPIRKRLSAIGSRLDELGSSHSELMGDVEALAENAGAIEKRLTSIEKRQREQHERMDRFMQDYREHKDFDFDMHDRIKALEGERPEVCDEPSTYTGSPIRVSISRDGIEHLAYAGNPDVAMRYAKKALDGIREA